MATNERTRLVAPCGIDCGICELYTCRDNEQLKAIMIAKGIPEEKLPCPGCRSVEGNCPVLSGVCATYACVTSKNAEYCTTCGDFPCEKFNPAADRADILPHNLKVFNLGVIERRGVEQFVKESATIKARYYKGKMAVGKGPQIASQPKEERNA